MVNQDVENDTYRRVQLRRGYTLRYSIVHLRRLLEMEVEIRMMMM